METTLKAIVNNETNIVDNVIVVAGEYELPTELYPNHTLVEVGEADARVGYHYINGEFKRPDEVQP